MSEPRQQSRVQLLLFRLHEQRLAVPIGCVWRVEPLAELDVTRVPRAPAFLRGVVNVRGHVLPVIDLRERFGLPPAGHLPRARLLVVEMERERAGLIVDAVTDISWYPAEAVQPPPPVVSRVSGLFVSGVVREDNDLIVVLDLRQVLTAAERQVLQEMDLPGTGGAE